MKKIFACIFICLRLFCATRLKPKICGDQLSPPNLLELTAIFSLSFADRISEALYVVCANMSACRTWCRVERDSL